MTAASHNGRSRGFTLFLCTVLHAFTHAYTVMLVPLALMIQADLRLEHVAQAMMLLTVQGLCYCAGCLPAGVLADHLSRRDALALGLLLNGAAFVGLAYSPTYLAALAAVACAGLAGSLYHPAGSALVVALYPERKGRAVGLAGMGAALGFAFGPWFGGLRADVYGWRRPCLELGLAGIAAAVLFRLLAQDPPVERADTPGKGRQPTLPMLAFFVIIALCFSMRDFGAVAIKPLATVLLQKAHAFSPKQTGDYFGLMSLTALIANPLFGALSDRRHRLGIAAGVLVVAGMGAAALPHASARFVLAPLVVFEFFVLASYPVVETALAESVPDRLRGRAFGLFITVAGLIGATAPWCMGEVVDAIGARATDSAAYVGTFAFLGALIAASPVGLLVLREFRRRHPVG